MCHTQSSEVPYLTAKTRRMGKNLLDKVRYPSPMRQQISYWFIQRPEVLMTSAARHLHTSAVGRSDVAYPSAACRRRPDLLIFGKLTLNSKNEINTDSAVFGNFLNCEFPTL